MADKNREPCDMSGDDLFEDGITNGADWYAVPGGKIIWISKVVAWKFQIYIVCFASQIIDIIRTLLNVFTFISVILKIL